VKESGAADGRHLTALPEKKGSLGWGKIQDRYGIAKDAAENQWTIHQLVQRIERDPRSR